MQLPVGTEDFGRIIERKLDFVDKTLLIKTLFDDKSSDVILITRPRRFGKTLNLSMLHYFLAEKVYGKLTQGLFDSLKIAQCGHDYMQHQGKYPVISISFKDVKKLNYDSACLHLSNLISDLYAEHEELLSSTKLSHSQKINFNKILERKSDEAKLQSSIKDLTHYLYVHHGIKPWLLIDEYDTPIQSGYINNYYVQIISLMRGLFSAALKTNPYMEKAVITGILRISKESLFSGVNNLKVYSVLNEKYSSYFGFTEPEVNELLTKADMLDKSADIKAWFNGYQFGNTVIYNPWSIASCLDENGATKPYWINTSDNQLIKDLFKQSPLAFKESFERLASGQTIEKLIDEHMVFQYLGNNPSAVWSLLLMSGYLKAVDSRETDQGTVADLAIPNKEVRNLYRQMIEQWLSNGYGIEWYNEFLAALLKGDMEVFKHHLEKIMLQIVSYHDLAKEPEAFYHGLMLGFTYSLYGSYDFKSNRESGLGRYDILLIPKDTKNLGIMIELKNQKDSEKLLSGKLAQKALRQIDKNNYISELKQVGIKKVLKIGIAFSGKEFVLCHAKEALN